jgi:hypothetical protein
MGVSLSSISIFVTYISVANASTMSGPMELCPCRTSQQKFSHMMT